MISVLSPRVFAVADSDRSFLHIDISPLYSTNFGLTHCSRYCEANNSSKRYEL